MGDYIAITVIYKPTESVITAHAVIFPNGIKWN